MKYAVLLVLFLCGCHDGAGKDCYAVITDGFGPGICKSMTYGSWGVEAEGCRMDLVTDHEISLILNGNAAYEKVECPK